MELIAAFTVTFFFSKRSHFFYFLACFSIDKLYVSYFKLAYADPRPYMIDKEIVPYTCSKAFGNPSGHSSAASLFAIVCFLDIFHGKPADKISDIRYCNWLVYILAIIVAIFWSSSIPFSRYLMGAHSLDQIIYGTSLGIWAGLTMHFLVRDNFIRHIELIINF